MRIAILNGSARPNNNADGVVEWVRQAVAKAPQVEVVSVDLKGNTPPLPLGVLTTAVPPLALPYIPGKKENPDGTITWPYLQPDESKWSEMVQSYDGLIIVSPEYNKCIPGEVKNTIDHIFPEWENFPIAVVTFGSLGGDSCAAQMTTLLKAIKAKNISTEELMVKIPFEQYIAGQRRTKPEDEIFEPLQGKLEEVVEELVAAGKERRSGMSVKVQ